MSSRGRPEFDGVWSLVSRQDAAMDGSPRVDPMLGSDPLGILTYANGRFAVQIMKRNRDEAISPDISTAGIDNTRSIGGYDAFFGSYVVNDATGEVKHRLEGALSAENIGMEVSRQLAVDGDRLVIRVETTTTEGEPITRTLTWERVT